MKKGDVSAPPAGGLVEGAKNFWGWAITGKERKIEEEGKKDEL